MPDGRAYGTHSRDYLERARARLDGKSPEDVLYAAFELRCGIEARLKEYLDVHDELGDKIKQGWRIPKLARGLEQHFGTGDKLIRITVHKPGNGPTIVFLYTPVSERLQKLGGRLDSLRHATEYHPADADWWKQTRALLEEAYCELAKATSGNLLGAPLLNLKPA